MNKKTGSWVKRVYKAGQGGLKPAFDKANPFVIDLWYLATRVKITLGHFLGPVLWHSYKRIKANKTALRIAVHLGPEPDAVSLVDTEFEEIDCGPTEYLAMNIAKEIVQVIEGGNPASLLRDPASNQGVVVDLVK